MKVTITFSCGHTGELEIFGNREKREKTIWTNSYFVSTVGGSPLAAVKKYIEQQKSV